MTKTTIKALAEDKSLHWYCEGCKTGVVTIWKKIKERQDELEEKMRAIAKEMEGLRKDTNTKQVKMEQEIGIMKKEMKGMKEAFEEVKKVNSGNDETFGDALEAKWVTVKAEVTGLESRLTTKYGEIKKDVETLEIEKKRTNIIFHGVKESDDVAEDVKKVRDILSNGLHLDCERHLGEMYRIGMKKEDKVRPIRLVVKSLEGKIEIIKRAKQLKDSSEFKKIFISPDLTRKQQLEDKELRDKLKSFRHDDHSGARITRWYAGWHSRTGRRGGRCEVGEAGELWDVVATIYTVCGRGQKFGRVMRLDHVQCLNVQCDVKPMAIGAIKLVPANGP